MSMITGTVNGNPGYEDAVKLAECFLRAVGRVVPDVENNTVLEFWRRPADMEGEGYCHTRLSKEDFGNVPVSLSACVRTSGFDGKYFGRIDLKTGKGRDDLGFEIEEKVFEEIKDEISRKHGRWQGVTPELVPSR